MNKQIICVCGFLALTASAGLAAADQPAKTPRAAATESGGDATFATINGQKIPLSLFRRFYLERLHQADTKENTPTFQNQVFNEFVNMLVAAQDARKRGLDKDEGFASALEIRRLQLLSTFAVQQIADTHKPSDKDLQQAYDERYGKEKRIEYKARHILVKTEDEGKQLIEELEGGADFTALAKAHSLEPSGKDGGTLSWLGPRQMVPAFAAATAALKPGEYSGKPVRTRFGWHIIRLEETRATEPPTLAEVTDELTLALRQSTLTNYISGLRDRTNLELNPDLIKVIQPDESQPTGSEVTEDSESRKDEDQP